MVAMVVTSSSASVRLRLRCLRGATLSLNASEIGLIHGPREVRCNSNHYNWGFLKKICWPHAQMNLMGGTFS